MKRSHRVYDMTKRVLDAVVAAIGLVALSPLLGLIALAVRVDLGAPVIFRQQRPGLGGRIFALYKFRTMRDAPTGTTAPEAVASDAARLTPLGRFLRSTSLDELPELYNILKGDMSLVGPRPLLVEYLDRYNSEQARRHDVRPGLTGWAQVNGRNAVSWPERFEMDVYYVDHRACVLDAKIMLMTIAAVFSRKGVSAPGSETVEPFAGAAPVEGDARTDAEEI